MCTSQADDDDDFICRTSRADGDDDDFFKIQFSVPWLVHIVVKSPMTGFEENDYLQRLLPITCQDHKLSSTSKDFSTPEAGGSTKFPKASNPIDPIDLHR